MKAGPGGGPVVSEPSVDHLAGALSLQLQFANATLRAVLEARRSIYPVQVSEAAENATDEDIRALKGSLKCLYEATADPDATAWEARQADRIMQAIENRDAEQARTISKKMHAAARRYWETHAPDLLDAPVSCAPL